MIKIDINNLSKEELEALLIEIRSLEEQIAHKLITLSNNTVEKYYAWCEMPNKKKYSWCGAAGQIIRDLIMDRMDRERYQVITHEYIYEHMIENEDNVYGHYNEDDEDCENFIFNEYGESILEEIIKYNLESIEIDW